MSVEKNFPEIRFKKFSGGWSENELGALIDIRSAARVHKEQWTDAGVPFFRTSDVVSIYKGQSNTKAYISQEVYQGLSEKIGKVTKGDLLITGGGSIGIPYLIPNDNPLYFKDADLLWLKNNQKFDGYFLYTFFFSAPFKEHIKSISHTGTIAHYTIEQAKATPINTCDEREQTQIGNYFQKLDSLIRQHQQKHDKFSNIKKSMLERMFPKQGETIPEIRFKGFSDEWKEKGITDISKVFIGLVTTMTTSYRSKGVLLIRNSDIKNNRFEFSASPIYLDEKFADKNSSRKLILGDVVTVHTGDVGTSAVITEKEEGSIGFAIIVSRPNRNIVDSNYLSVFLNTDIHKSFAINVSTGDGRANYNLKDFYKLNVPLPAVDEQVKLGLCFQKLDCLINQHQQQITKLNNIKQACLRKMFV